MAAWSRAPLCHPLSWEHYLPETCSCPTLSPRPHTQAGGHLTRPDLLLLLILARTPVRRVYLNTKFLRMSSQGNYHPAHSKSINTS